MKAALGLCLLGATLVFFAASRTWKVVVTDQGDRLPPLITHEAGPDGLRGLALVGFAGVVALLAARGWGRVVVGLVLLAGGVGTLVASLTQGGTTGWPWVAAFGGGLLAAAGGLTATRGRSWGGLSGAYRTPAARAEEPPATDKGVWDALDRGEDPTDTVRP